MKKENNINEGDFVFVKSEGNLIAEVIGVKSGSVEGLMLLYFHNRRPSSGDKREVFPISDLVLAEYDWDKDKYIASK